MRRQREAGGLQQPGEGGSGGLPAPSCHLLDACLSSSACQGEESRWSWRSFACCCGRLRAATAVAAAHCWGSSRGFSLGIYSCLGCACGLDRLLLSVNSLPACSAASQTLLQVESALGRLAVSRGFPTALCAPYPTLTQVRPPGEWQGECGAAAEPADSGGVASNVDLERIW